MLKKDKLPKWHENKIASTLSARSLNQHREAKTAPSNDDEDLVYIILGAHGILINSPNFENAFKLLNNCVGAVEQYRKALMSPLSTPAEVKAAAEEWKTTGSMFESLQPFPYEIPNTDNSSLLNLPAVLDNVIEITDACKAAEMYFRAENHTDAEKLKEMLDLNTRAKKAAVLSSEKITDQRNSILLDISLAKASEAESTKNADDYKKWAAEALVLRENLKKIDPQKEESIKVIKATFAQYYPTEKDDCISRAKAKLSA